MSPIAGPARPGRTTTGRRRAIAIGLVAASVVAASLAAPVEAGRHKPPQPPKPPARTVELQLLAFNDYHGHLERTTPGTVDGATGSPAGGGAEFLATKLAQLRQGKRNSLTVAAGDLIGGSPFLSGAFHDEPSVESLNALGLDIASVGNHEFDEGVRELLRMQYGGCHPVDGCYFPGRKNKYQGADFRWLAANVVHERTKLPPLPPFWIEKVQGVKVAFIGMTLEDTDTLVAQSGIERYDFLDEADTANRLVPLLRFLGAESIVVLLHEGAVQGSGGTFNGCVGINGPVIDINSRLSPAIDAVITGHTHAPYNCMLPDPRGNLRPVTSSFSFGRIVTEINLVIDTKTRDVIRNRTTAVNHQVIQSQLTPDPAQTAILAKWKPLADATGLVEVGETTAPATRAFTGTAEDRGLESSASNLIADAQLAATASTAGAQIALMNPGGVRADFDAGPVTYAEAFNMQPFSNSLQTIPMTGEQLAAALAQQCQPSGVGRPFLHLGVSTGLTYTLDRTLEDINPAPDVTVLACTSVSITDLALDGVAIDPAATYQVTINNFLADGGDNFGVFATIDRSLRVGGGIDLDALIAYLGANDPLAPPGTDRVTELFAP